MFRANQIVAGALNLLRERMTPGITTLDLDQWAAEYCKDQGGVPAFKGYRGYPGNLCVSLNEQVVHGIPSRKTVVRDGDIVSVDFGVQCHGFYGDAAISIPVGEIPDRKKELLDVTRRSLYLGIEKARAGNRVSDISGAIQDIVERHGFSVVRQFVGHGIGTSLHEQPEIPNYRKNGRSPRLVAGMVLAIEPMVNLGTSDVKVLRDGWTVVTADRRVSAHFEHSVLVTDGEPVILSDGCMTDPGID